MSSEIRCSGIHFTSAIYCRYKQDRKQDENSRHLRHPQKEQEAEQ